MAYLLKNYLWVIGLALITTVTYRLYYWWIESTNQEHLEFCKKWRSTAITLFCEDISKTFNFNYELIPGHRSLDMGACFDEIIKDHIIRVYKSNGTNLNTLNTFMKNPCQNFMIRDLLNNHGILIRRINKVKLNVQSDYSGECPAIIREHDTNYNVLVDYRVDFPEYLQMKETYDELMSGMSGLKLPSPIELHDDARDAIYKYLNTVYPGFKFGVTILKVELQEAL
jgi:hypothetical protein